jgi:hypothetical protein
MVTARGASARRMGNAGAIIAAEDAVWNRCNRR